MTEIIIRTDEGADQDVPFSWDMVWRNDIGGGSGDWVIADDEERENNRGGLQARDQLATAITLQLFTKRRRPDYLESPDGGQEPWGWFGDSFDIERTSGEGAIGSFLYLMEREPINYQTQLRIQHYASEALQTLVDQGWAHHFEIETQADHVKGIIFMIVRAFDPENAEPIFQNTFPLQ